MSTPIPKMKLISIISVLLIVTSGDEMWYYQTRFSINRGPNTLAQTPSVLCLTLQMVHHLAYGHFSILRDVHLAEKLAVFVHIQEASKCSKAVLVSVIHKGLLQLQVFVPTSQELHLIPPV